MGSLIRDIVQSVALVASLPQTATNGPSQLGTLQAPTFPDFLSGVGVIRPYDFTISRGYIAPDGVNRSVMLINGQFPGPTIEANWGDTFSITVRNKLEGPEEGTGLHWHGILQRATPWYDGVPAVQQCPIAPGKSLTYTFKADLFGTSWYHSHYSAQYAAGLFGAMIIHGPHENFFYDVDVGPVLLSDWYHSEYFELVKQTMTPGARPVFADNNLINGKMNFDCSKIPAGGRSCTPNAGIAKFNFQSGKTHRLRLINAGAEALQRFSIDGHTMTVVANDYVPVVPYQTNVVTLGIGQRTDVIVKANMAPTASVFMRANMSIPCSLTNQPYAVAAIYYEKADKTKTPKSTAQVFEDKTCGNDPLTKTRPLFPYPALANAATTVNIDITAGPNKTGHFLWYMNGQSFRANYDHPVYLLAAAGNTSYPYDPQWNVINLKGNNSVRVIVNNKFPAAHPMHLHGHNFFVLAEGLGTWDGKITGYPNTQRRDVQQVQGNGYLVIQYDTDNPGVWPFHCHIAWHVSAGLYVNLMEQPDKINDRGAVPQTIVQTCRDWSAYSGSNIVDQIDSGL
ncbi:MAG: hypothetical protein Q9173_003972 [Seirophora scorigena]